MKKPISLLSSLLLSTGALAQKPAVQTDQWSVFAQFDSFSYSEIMPIEQLLEDMEGSEFESGDVAFTHNLLEAGASYGNFELAVFARYDYYLDFSSDTAELVYRDKNDLPVGTNRSYDIDLEANHLRATGLKLAYRFVPLENLRIKAAISYLQADKLVDGDIRGTVATTANDYNGELKLDYAYSEDLLFDREAQEPDGSGYSLDLHAWWQVNEQLALEVRLEDIVSRIEWDDAPYTEARVTSDTVNFDENGFLNTTPALSGIEAYKQHDQQLPARSTVTALYRVEQQIDLLASWKRVGDTDFPVLGLRYHTGLSRYWQVSYDAKAEAFGTSYHAGTVGASLSLDNPKLDEAHALGLNFFLRVPF